MTKNIAWIWLLALLIAVGLIVAGCGEPSRAERETLSTASEQVSSGEVIPAETEEPEPEVAAKGPAEALDAQAALERRERELEAREAAVEARERELEAETRVAADEGLEPAPPTNEAEELIPIDRFRAIPMQRDRPAEEPVRERFEEIALLVPAGTPLEVEFIDALSSERNQVGDRFTVRVTEAVTVDGYFAIPVGSEVGGEVVGVERLKKIGGRARLELVFDQLGSPSGEILPVQASLTDTGRSETKKDAATIGGAAAAGAVVGRAVKDKKRTKGGILGALIGAAVGAGIAAHTEGEPVEIPSGAVATLTLEEDLPVVVRVRILES